MYILKRACLVNQNKLFTNKSTMKRILSIVFLLTGGYLFSQSEATTNFGIKGGYNYSDVIGKQTNGDPTGYIGYEAYVGLFSESKLSQNWYIGNELLFSYTDTYNYLEIPVLAKVQLAQRWKVFAGPRLDLIISDYDNIEYKFKTLGYSIETGVEFKINRKSFLEMRYAYGLKEQINDLILDINNAKRNTFRIGLGIRF